MEFGLSFWLYIHELYLFGQGLLFENIFNPNKFLWKIQQWLDYYVWRHLFKEMKIYLPYGLPLQCVWNLVKVI